MFNGTLTPSSTGSVAEDISTELFSLTMDDSLRGRVGRLVAKRRRTHSAHGAPAGECSLRSMHCVDFENANEA
jgi:hypothetical protein